jgi:uncharacterized protein YerC
MATERFDRIKTMLMAGKGVRETARETGAGTATVQRIKRSMTVEGNRAATVRDDLIEA